MLLKHSSYGGGGAGWDRAGDILLQVTVEELDEGTEGGETVLPAAREIEKGGCEGLDG